MSRDAQAHRAVSVWGMVVAWIGISAAAPLVRTSHAHPVAIAFWRLGFSLVVIVVALLVTGEWRDWRRLHPRDALVGMCGGAFLAVHFWCWNSAVHMTSIAASTALVTLQPVIVALFSSLMLREAPSRSQATGIGFAVVGALIISAPDLMHGVSLGNRPLAGNLLAMLGTVMASAYFTTSRHLRQRLNVWSFAGLVYGSCFVTLFVIGTLGHVRLYPQPTREIPIFVGLALGPMLMGHTMMNWTVRYLPAYVVSLTVLGEPIGATLLGMLLPWVHEIPTWWTVAGGAVLLAGATTAIMADRTRRTAAALPAD